MSSRFTKEDLLHDEQDHRVWKQSSADYYYLFTFVLELIRLNCIQIQKYRRETRKKGRIYRRLMSPRASEVDFEVESWDSSAADQSQDKMTSFFFTLVLLPNLKDSATWLRLPCWQKQESSVSKCLVIFEALRKIKITYMERLHIYY